MSCTFFNMQKYANIVYYLSDDIRPFSRVATMMSADIAISTFRNKYSPYLGSTSVIYFLETQNALAQR